MTEQAFQNHKAKGKHDFPPNDLKTEVLLKHTSGRYAAGICGEIPNRCRVYATDLVIDAYVGTIPSFNIGLIGNKPSHEAFFGTGFYRKRRKDRTPQNFHASKELFMDLEALFLDGETRDGVNGGKLNASKYTADDAQARLANMVQSNGRRKYSPDPSNPNGPLPTISYIRNWFSRRARGDIAPLAHLDSSEADIYDNMTLDALKKECSKRHIVPTAKHVMINLLNSNDILNGSSIDTDAGATYEKLSSEVLIQLCKDNGLPYTVSMKALKLLLKNKDKVIQMQAHQEKEREQFELIRQIQDSQNEADHLLTQRNITISSFLGDK